MSNSSSKHYRKIDSRVNSLQHDLQKQYLKYLTKDDTNITDVEEEPMSRKNVHKADIKDFPTNQCSMGERNVN